MKSIKLRDRTDDWVTQQDRQTPLMSLEEAGRHLGVSHRTASLIERSARQKIREGLMRDPLVRQLAAEMLS